jgi:hypothetical protein
MRIDQKAGEIMKKFILTGLALVFSMAASAQDDTDDGTRVVLPIETQQCKLPSAPPPIPEVPVKDELINAQKQVKRFQEEVAAYRGCLEKDQNNPDLTWGNQQAIANAYDYSVDMETRVAEMFNEALRAYKAAQTGN